MKMQDWNEGEWLQWLYSVNIKYKKYTNAERLLYEMDDWNYPRLECLITSVNTFTTTQWKYNCPMWLDDSKFHCVYNRLFTVFKAGTNEINNEHTARICIDDIDDGDNLYYKNFNTQLLAEIEVDDIYSIFAKEQTVLNNVFLHEILLERGFYKI